MARETPQKPLDPAEHVRLRPTLPNPQALHCLVERADEQKIERAALAGDEDGVQVRRTQGCGKTRIDPR
jgi:hypothetical protein